MLVGTPVCETCAKESKVVVQHDDPVLTTQMKAELGGSRKQSTRKKRDKRMHLLAKPGITELAGSVVNATEQVYGQEPVGMPQSPGLQCHEADVLTEPKKNKRGEQLGYDSVVKCFYNDRVFRRHMTACGDADEELEFLASLRNFPAPPRSRGQIVLNTGENQRLDHGGCRLGFIDSKSSNALPAIAMHR